MTDSLLELVTEVHAAPSMLVYEFAGAGVQALAWLHAVGGSSRTVLEATDRYAPRSLAEVLDGPPTKAVSVDVARGLARHAFVRAARLADAGVSVVGIGCTATIATDRRKRGEHGAAIVAASVLGTLERSLVLRKGDRDRDAEEVLVSRLVLQTIASASGVLRRVRTPLLEGEEIEERFESAPLLASFERGERQQIALDADGSLCADLPWPVGGGALVSGAFNPLHEGHLGLAAAAHRHLGRPVAFELALANAEKPTIDVAESYPRAMQFPGRAPLLVTRAPLFSEKAALAPGSVFVIGADTAARVLSERFYRDALSLDASLDAVREHGSSFLVAGRRSGERFVTLADIAIPARHVDLFEALPEEAFRADVSSSGIREGWGTGAAA